LLAFHYVIVYKDKIFQIRPPDITGRGLERRHPVVLGPGRDVCWEGASEGDNPGPVVPEKRS